MQKILSKTDNACSSYIQGNEVCSNCVRNIGFYSNGHSVWHDYKFVNDLCSGYIEKPVQIKKKVNLSHWLS